MAETNSEGWTLKRELSLGDLLAIVIALVSVISAYHAIDIRLTVVEKEQVVARERDDVVTTALKELNAKFDRLLDRLSFPRTPQR
jgi:hypothetical protein